MTVCDQAALPRVSVLHPSLLGRKAREGACWYAVYTLSRHEKMVSRHFAQRGITHFLPLYLAVHQWNKRMARVSLPLFPGYVFVQTDPEDRQKPLQVPGVLYYVGTGSTSHSIPDAEINALRQVLLSGKQVGPHPYLVSGNSVRIARGPLSGLQGVIERTKGGNRLIISVELIQRSMTVELDAESLAVELPAPAAAFEYDSLAV